MISRCIPNKNSKIYKTDMNKKQRSAINLACGGKFCNLSGWINADHNPSSQEVLRVNLLKPLPFENNSFDVVYHSQFIEHLTFDDAEKFLEECFRILKPNGILRVVTPDFQNQVKEYLKNLENVLKDPLNKVSKLRYEWIRLELMDQLTRNETGGEMSVFLANSSNEIQDYLDERLGRSGVQLNSVFPNKFASSLVVSILKQIKVNILKIYKKLVPASYLVGGFRLSGEVHYTMFDKFLLSDMLYRVGFDDVEVMSAQKSNIENWKSTLLDSDHNGLLDCPTSLFMEAKKCK